MAYKRGAVYWTRVKLSRGGACERSTETGNKAVAQAIESTLADCYASRRWDLLDAVAAKRITVGELYDNRNDLDAVSARLADIDLLPLVDQWHAENISRKLRSANRYRSQLCAVLGGAARRSDFRREMLSQSLNGLATSTSTRNRYRAALSAFGSWMVERGHLSHNPVRDVRGFKQNPPRDIWLPRADAQRLIAALPEPLRASRAGLSPHLITRPRCIDSRRLRWEAAD